MIPKSDCQPVFDTVRRAITASLLAVLAGCGGGSGDSAVSGPPAIGQLTLSTSASSVANGETATLTWTGTGVSNCMASGAWSGPKSTSDSEVVGPLNANADFTLACDSSTGTVSRSVSISVNASAGPVVNLQASPQSVVAGGNSTLTWSSTGAVSCSASGGWSGAKNLSGSENVGPINQATTFTLDCTDGSANTIETATVTLQTASTQLLYSTYIGGSRDDLIRDVAVGPDGSVYLAGRAGSDDFPAQNGFDTTFNGVFDVVVLKFTAGGTFVWSTFIGGAADEYPYAIEVDGNGDVYVAGQAGAGFPTTSGVVQRIFAGETGPIGIYGPQDGFVTKLSTSGQLVWSTYLGGDSHGFIRDIDIDATGNVYVALSEVSGSPASVAHLITANSFQTSNAGGTDGIVAKLRNDGSVIEWGTYLGGSGSDNTNPSIRLDQQGNVLVTGYTDSSDMPVRGGLGSTFGGQLDMHLTKFLPDGSDIVYAGYIGGSAIDATETHGLAVDSAGNAYVSAGTNSADFPVTTGAFQSTLAGSADAFITKVSPQGDLLASTYFGGSGQDAVEGVSIGANGDVFVSGPTESSDFFVTSNAAQSQFGGRSDIFAARFTNDLANLVYSTYVGGSEYDLARSSWVDGNVLSIVGHTNSSDLPVTNNAFDTTLNGSPNTADKFTGDGVLLQIQIP